MTDAIIGANIPQVTGRAKVSGTAIYAGDIKLAGMLHGKVLRSPYPHARIVSIDTSKAKALKGVKAVITGEDTPTRLWGVSRKERRILAAGKVRYAGEEVAAVAAISEDIARDAIDLIRVEYEELPAVLDPFSALEPGAIEIHEGTGNIAYETHVDRGDVERGFDQAAAIYEATYSMPYQYPGYLEPMASVVDVDTATGRITVWAATQSIFMSRSRLAEALDVPHSQIRFIQTMTGGAFGGKAVEDANTPIAALLAIKSGKPVRLANNRLEDFLAAPSSMPATVWLRMGLSKDGLIVAKDSMIIGDNGAYTGLAGHVIHVTSMRSDNMHRIGNVRARGKLVYTNKIPSGAFRGFGGQQMAFPLNSHLAMLAEMVGIDPLEVQLRNAIKTGETSVHGWHMGSCGLSDCLTQATQGIGWAEKRKASKDVGPIKRGTGVAAGIHVSANRQLGNWDGSTAIVKMNEDGRVTLITPECDMGQGAATVLSQICAHELNIPISHVTVPQPDTDSTPFGIGTVASRVTIIAGNAVRLAAIKAREQLFEVAAEKLDSDPHALEIHNGMIRVKADTSRAVSLPDAVRLHLFRVGGQGIFAQATYDPPTVMADANYYGNVAPAYSFAAQAVEVEVDTETGQVRVVDSFVSDDCGKALNPMAVHGQTNGATAQSTAWALYESLNFEDGRLMNGNFADYAMPTADALPAFKSGFIESNDPNGPYGAKGASETAVLPGAAAIANAVYDAVGVRINDLPITPEKVLAALREKHNAGDQHA